MESQMSIESVLRKEGIKEVKPLDTLTTIKLAKNITDKLCVAFLDFGLDADELFSNICRIKMYSAHMPETLSKAKYYYKDNSIYFDQELSMQEMESLATHECIHYIQRVIDTRGNLLRLGLCSLPETKANGLALNEAAVQLMSSVAEKKQIDTVKYYQITISTISPNAYPLECVLVNQMAYFTGDYPLYYSTLNSNDLFQKTFIVKSNEQTYFSIVSELDALLQLEEELNSVIGELKYSGDNVNKIRRINKEIEYGKKMIYDKFFKIQDLIILNCFTNEFNSIKTLSDASVFKKRVYDYKDLIGYSENYSFYNDFYCKIMAELEKKEDYIKEYGPIDLIGSLNAGMALTPKIKNSLSFFKRILKKLGILVKE